MMSLKDKIMQIRCDPESTLKDKIIANPFSCVYHWGISWVIAEIKNLPKGSKILEMGTFVGGTTRLLALANPAITVHTIDINYTGEQNRNMVKTMIDTYGITGDIDLEYIQYCHLADLPNVVKHIGNSSEIDLQDVSLVFIDAGHTYEACYADLNKAWDITVDGGYLFGDDVDAPGVYNAVCQFAADKDVSYTIYSKLFKIQKHNAFDYKRNTQVERIARFE